MSIILDVILLAIFVAFILVAAKKGFVLTFLELIAVVVALIVSYQLSPVVAQATYDKVVEPKIIETVEQKIDETVDISATSEQATVIIDSIPKFMVKYAASVGVDTEEIKEKISSEELSSENIAIQLTQRIAQPIAIGALTVIFFLLISAVLLFVLRLLAQLLSKSIKIPIMKKTNSVLGGVIGACKGLLVVIFICTILDFLFSGSEGEIAEIVNKSYIMGMLDDINPFIKSLKEIF